MRGYPGVGSSSGTRTARRPYRDAGIDAFRIRPNPTRVEKLRPASGLVDVLKVRPRNRPPGGGTASRLARVATPMAGKKLGDVVMSGRGGVVDGAGQCRRGPAQPAMWVGQELGVGRCAAHTHYRYARYV